MPKHLTVPFEDVLEPNVACSMTVSQSSKEIVQTLGYKWNHPVWAESAAQGVECLPGMYTTTLRFLPKFDKRKKEGGVGSGKEERKKKIRKTSHLTLVDSPATCPVVIFAIGLDGRRRVMVMIISWRALHTIGFFGHSPCTSRALTWQGNNNQWTLVPIESRGASGEQSENTTKPTDLSSSCVKKKSLG